MPMEVASARVTKRLRQRVVAGWALGLCLWVHGAGDALASHARGNRAWSGPVVIAQAAPRISEDQAAAIVRGHTGGRILGVRRRVRRGRSDFEVKVLKDGRVSVHVVDGATGKIRR